MEDGCAELDLGPNLRTSFVTLSGTPEEIQSQRDVESVVIPTCDYLLTHPADACVIGCFSDPGLVLCREEMSVPVVGIAESAYLEASAVHERFGVVSIGKGSIARHARAIGALGLGKNLAGDRPLNLGVLDLLDRERTMTRIIEVGRELRDFDRAAVLILGCATMGVFRASVETALAIPVIDPTQAGIRRAASLL
jgi:Asp/Glu/hydantoin racemase